MGPKPPIFVSTKFHFDETISLAGLVSSMMFVVCPTFMGTLRLYNFCYFGATLLGFGTVFTNIILHGFRNFGKNRITLTPLKKPQNPQKTLMETLRLCTFCNFGATLLEFGTVFTNIILHGIRNFG